MLQVVKVSDATSHARYGLGGAAPYEIVIEVEKNTNKLAISVYFYIVVDMFQDSNVPPLGFKTYFFRQATKNETVVGGTKFTMLSETKKIPQDVKEDILLENEVCRDIE